MAVAVVLGMIGDGKIKAGVAGGGFICSDQRVIAWSPELRRWQFSGNHNEIKAISAIQG